MSNNERRRHPRMRVRMVIKRRTTVHEPEQVDYATDLSEGGLFIRTDSRAKPGATLQLAFAPADQTREVNARGRVVRVTDDGMAIEFIELDPDSRLLLSYALAS